MRLGQAGFATLEEAAAALSAYNPHRPRPKNLDGLQKNLRLHTDGRWHWHWDPAFMDVDPDDTTRGMAEDRRRRAATRVRIPTLLVRGTESDVVSIRGARELLELIPGARLAEVPQAGHMVAGDDNDAFSAEIEAFLAALTSAEVNCVWRPEFGKAPAARPTSVALLEQTSGDAGSPPSHGEG
jgi:pimeloyl-ACP methyl ester carboxylesterase